jgi:hypothetical protein
MGLRIGTNLVRALSATALLAAGMASGAGLPGRAAAPAPAAAQQPPAADTIALAPASAAAVLAPSAPDAWGGPRSGTEPTLSDRVVDYRIEATLDPVRHAIAGKEKLTWRNRSKVAVRSVYLHLYMNAFEGAGSTFFTEKRVRETGFRSGVDTKDGEWGHIALRNVTQGGARVPWTFVHPDHGPSRSRRAPPPASTSASTPSCRA